MREKIERYARSLEGLSIEELSESAEKLVSLQRRNDAALIAHLVEISRRKGHLELGYRNLFDYCQERLRLGDGGAVWRRTQVAGVARRFPQVLEHLARGSVNLSVLVILASPGYHSRVSEHAGDVIRSRSRAWLAARETALPAAVPGFHDLEVLPCSRESSTRFGLVT